MQAQRIFVAPLIAIHRPEPPGIRLVISGTEIIHLQIAVELLAAVQIIIRRASRAGNQQPVRIIRVGVRDAAIGVKQEPGAAMLLNMPGQALRGKGEHHREKTEHAAQARQM